MKRYQRLALVTILGVASMCLLTWGLYALRDALDEHGYMISQGAFLISFFIVVGGAFSLAAHLALREVKRLEAGESNANQTPTEG